MDETGELHISKSFGLQDGFNAFHLGTKDINNASELHISKCFRLQDIILCSIQVDPANCRLTTLSSCVDGQIWMVSAMFQTSLHCPN